MSADLSMLENESYINLETYKRNKQLVKTPVWFILKDKNVFVVTKENTGKVKRIRNSGNVRIAPCNFRGKIKSDWIPGVAKILDPNEQLEIIDARNKKYGFKATLANLVTTRKGNYTVIKIET